MVNKYYDLPIEFTLVKNREYSRTGTLLASVNFRYISGLKNKEDIRMVKEAFDLIRRTGIDERIIKEDTSFPSKLRVIYSITEVLHNCKPRIDISPIEDELIFSSLNVKSYKKHPRPDIFEARPDAVHLFYDFVEIILRYQQTEENILLTDNNCMLMEVEQWH